MHTIALSVVAAFATILAMLVPVWAASLVRFEEWGRLSSERYGFEISYPVSVFAGNAGLTRIEGHMLISRDGAARLAIATFENDGGSTLAEYRQQLLKQNYRGADLDYAPQKSEWFVLSGSAGDMQFYERVTFTCGGRLINSWALLFPTRAKRFYESVVEAIAPTYMPGAGRDGACR